MSWVRFPSPAPRRRRLAYKRARRFGGKSEGLGEHCRDATLRRSTAKERALGMGESMSEQSGRRTGWSWWYLLFVVQVAAVIWPPLYNRIEPTWIGMPFFYWYQLLWVIVGAVLTAIVYFATED